MAGGILKRIRLLRLRFPFHTVDSRHPEYLCSEQINAVHEDEPATTTTHTIAWPWERAWEHAPPYCRRRPSVRGDTPEG